MLKTSEWLVRMRLNGKKPPMVFIEIDREQPSDWFAWKETWSIPVLSISSAFPVERLDLRCLVGLNVSIIADAYSPWLWALWGKIKEALPGYAALNIRSFAKSEIDDFGWHWTAASGEKLLTEACP